jgi:2-polyprenyl-6-methoxyphenol hydroxylase-like FAD-dependent oxidoreductase
LSAGGIGGLTAALSLHQIGVDFLVFESVSLPRPLGVGINVLPHAVRELTELGLEGALAETGIPTVELAYYNKHGQRIWSELRSREAGYNWPQFSIHRGLLQPVLLEAARDRLGAHNILTGHHLDGWEVTSTKVTARFIDKRSATGCRIRTATCCSAPTASIPPCGRYCIQMRGRRCGTAPFSSAARRGQSRS